MDETNDPGDKPINVLVEIVRLNKVASVQRQQRIETRTQDQEAGRRQAAEYAPEALLKVVSLLRTTKDDATILKCAKFITDRAWGTPKPLTEEEKKGADSGSILDVLAAASVHNRNLEITIKQEALAKPEPKEINGKSDVVDDIEGFFREVDDDDEGEPA